jgi:hypothetical protein
MLTYSECVFVALVILHVNAHAPYSHLWPFSLCGFFSTLSQELARISDKMYVLIFSTTCVWNISHSRQNWERCCHKCLFVCMWSGPCYCQILENFEFCRHASIFRNYSDIKFHENSVQWEPSCFVRTDGRTDRQTDRHDEANSCFSQFCERA